MLRKPDNWPRQPHPYRRASTSVLVVHPEPTWPTTIEAVEKFLDLRTLPTEGRNRPLDPAFQLPKVAAFRSRTRCAAGPLAVQFLDGGGEPDRSARRSRRQTLLTCSGVPRRACRILRRVRHRPQRGAPRTRRTRPTCRPPAPNGRRRAHLSGSAPSPGCPTATSRSVWQQPRPEAGPIRLPLQRIGTRRVVLSAGALGSTYLLLLTNRERLGPWTMSRWAPGSAAAAICWASSSRRAGPGRLARAGHHVVPAVRRRGEQRRPVGFQDTCRTRRSAVRVLARRCRRFAGPAGCRRSPKWLWDR